MKKIFYLIALCLSAASCGQLLDTKPYDKYTEDMIWNNADYAQDFVYNTQYFVVKDFVTSPGEWEKIAGTMIEDLSDNMIVQKGSMLVDISKDIMSADKNYSWNAFHLIRQANLIIEKSAASTALSEKQKAEFVAQGKILRAMVYFKKARFFGKYIKIDRVLTPEDEFKLPRTKTIKETYDFILQDLEDAAEGLPTTAPVGHFTKGAALAMMQEVALQASAFAEEGEQEYYQIAKKAAEDLFALGVYKLDPDYKRMFNDYEYAQKSQEIIFAWWKSAANTTFKDTHMLQSVCNLEYDRTKPFATPKLKESLLGWGGRTPSWELVEEYEVIDEDGVAKKWNETSYYKNFKQGEDYVSQMLFKNRDKRFYATMVYDSTMYFANLVTMRDKGNLHWKSTQKKPELATQSGFWLRKTIYEQQQCKQNLFTNAHMVYFRLGRSYLNYAETMLRLGDVATAVEYINKTRTLHGGLPALADGLSEADVWKAYKSERRVELCFENDRYWSLLRWGKHDNLDVIPELNHPYKHLEISADGKSYLLEDLPAGDSQTRNDKKFSKRRYFFPIPNSERVLNPNLDQNPEW